MQIKYMKSYTEWRKMYAAWINTGNGWVFSNMRFESVDVLEKYYKGILEFLGENHLSQAKRWENAEIIVVSVEVPIPDETKEVRK